MTYHSFMISLQHLHHLLRGLVPQEHVTAVTATHDIVTVQAKEIHPLHWRRIGDEQGVEREGEEE